MHFQIVKMHKDKEVNKIVKNIFLSMCDVRVFLTFTSLRMFQEIRIIATGPCKANQLRDVNEAVSVVMMMVVLDCR
jgi:hypothetical protein